MLSLIQSARDVNLNASSPLPCVCVPRPASQAGVSNRGCFSSQLWRLEPETQELATVVPSEASLLVSQTAAFSQCPHAVIPPCEPVS